MCLCFFSQKGSTDSQARRGVAAAVVLQLRGVPETYGAEFRQQHGVQHHGPTGWHRLPALPRTQLGGAHGNLQIH